MEAAQARLSLHLSKCHIVGNHTPRLINKITNDIRYAAVGTNTQFTISVSFPVHLCHISMEF